MLSCVIIDDELHCVDVVSAMVKQKFADRVTISGTATEGRKAVEMIKALHPDIVFLDVEMPGFSGMQLLASFPERNFSVVFTTAHPGYALEALKTEAVDYLLKPISLKELGVAIEKCEKKAALLHPAEQINPAGKKKILLPSGKGTLLINADEIIRFESCNNYCKVYFTERPKLVVARTLKVFDDQLNQSGFFRIHQSHFVNLAHVRSYQNGDTSYAILSDGTKVEISRRRKSEFLKVIGKS